MLKRWSLLSIVWVRDCKLLISSALILLDSVHGILLLALRNGRYGRHRGSFD